MLSTLEPWVVTLAAAAQDPTGGLGQTVIMFGMFFGIIYFLVLRPQKQKEQEHQEMLKALQKNDPVVTQGGLYGVVARIEDDDVILKIDLEQSVKVKVRKSAIVGLAPDKSKKTEKTE